jgi:hypothetical protein
LNEQQIAAHQAKQGKEIADGRKAHPIPADWDDIEKTPVKLTIPAGGGKFTIDVADEKTFVQ